MALSSWILFEVTKHCIFLMFTDYLGYINCKSNKDGCRIIVSGWPLPLDLCLQVEGSLRAGAKFLP